MPQVTIDLLSPHPKQAEILSHPARFKVIACGRRFGKTELCKIAEAEAALRGLVVWHVALNYPQSTEYWERLKDTLAPVAAKKTESVRRLDFRGGGSITVRSAHEPDSLRGTGLDLAVLDEAAFMAEGVWSGAVRPALSDRLGRCMMPSTPCGLNWFFRVFSLGQDPDVSEWASWHLPTAANPYIPSSEIEEARRTLPDLVFRQEYEAEFAANVTAVFRRLEGACTGEPTAPQPGVHYVHGLDWGRSNDATVLATFDAAGHRLVHLDRFTQVGYGLQRARVAAVHEAYPGPIYAESNSIGQPNIEALLADGLPVIPFATTAQSKAPLIDALALALERDEIILLRDPVLVGELRAYRQERLPSGLWQYGAAAGMHDDCVMAVALGWHGVQYGGPGISFT